MSLDLDIRQRAMLQEMGLRVWLPEPNVVAAPAPLKASALRSVLSAPQQPTAAPIKNSAAHPADAGASDPQPSKIGTAVPDPATPAPAARAPDLAVLDMAALDWPALAHTVAHCEACQLCRGRRAPVFNAASADHAPGPADWMLVGEPPDEAEERAGSPFAAQAGQLLDNMLKSLGLSRQGEPGSPATTAYVTNVVKCRPAAQRTPEPQELATCESYLRREVALVQPKVILALGRFAAQTLLRASLPDVATIPLGKLRGPVYHYQGIPVVVSYHPSYLLRTPLDKARAWADWCLALKHSK